MSAIVVALVAAGTLSSCALKSPNEYVLPGGVATGSDGYRITAEFASVENLVPNSQVLYNDVAVGTVETISFDNWNAKVTLSLKKSVHLPGNVTFMIAQKSLLGAEYVEVDDPHQQPSGALAGGASIPLTQTGHYPETEQVLAAVALLLSNGGLNQIKTISTEVDAMLGSTAQQQAARKLIGNLQTVLGNLNSEKTQIIGLMSALNRLGATLAQERNEVATAIDDIDPGLKVLNAERGNLTTALEAVGNFGVVGTKLINEAGGSLLANLANLKPILTQLKAAGSALPNSLYQLAAFPFPIQNISKVFKGDYGNLFVTFDATLPTLLTDFGGVSTTGAATSPALAQALQANNPITAPLHTSPSAAPKASASTAAPGLKPSPGASAPTPSPAPSSSAGCNLLQAVLGEC